MEIPNFMRERAVEALRELIKAIGLDQTMWKAYDNAVLVLKDIEFWNREE